MNYLQLSRTWCQKAACGWWFGCCHCNDRCTSPELCLQLQLVPGTAFIQLPMLDMCWRKHFFDHVFIFLIFFFFFNSSTVVGDKTPGGSTPSITSITNIILLPQHDAEIFQHGDSEESIFSCPRLNRMLQQVVMEISVQPQILICSSWFLVWNHLHLVANSLK